MLLSEQQTGIGASAGIFGNGNSNDAKIRLLERRLRGDTPSPGKLNRALSIGEVSKLSLIRTPLHPPLVFLLYNEASRAIPDHVSLRTFLMYGISCPAGRVR